MRMTMMVLSNKIPHQMNLQQNLINYKVSKFYVNDFNSEKLFS